MRATEEGYIVPGWLAGVTYPVVLLLGFAGNFNALAATIAIVAMAGWAVVTLARA